MELISLALKFGPFGQLLGQAAVLGLLALAKRQAQIHSDLSQPLHHLHDVQIAARKEFFQRKAIRWRVGVKRKRNPLDNNVIMFS